MFEEHGSSISDLIVIEFVNRAKVTQMFGGLLAALFFLNGPIQECSGNDAYPPIAQAERTSFRIVGYLPEYRRAKFNPDDARFITDLIYFEVEPRKTVTPGSIALSRRR